MKKFLAIFVVFTLIAGVAFAEINVSGAIETKAIVAEGKGDDKATVGFENDNIRIGASAQNDEGTFGGEFRFQANDTTWDNAAAGVKWHQARANIWWKPIEQVKLQLGSGLDGSFGADNNLGWGFYATANRVVMEEYWFGGLPGITGNGLLLSINPISGLDINLAFPYNNPSTDLENAYKQTLAEVNYSIDGIGKIIVDFKGGLGKGTSFNRAGVGFDLSAIENLSVFVFAQFGFPIVDETAGTKTTSYDQIKLGIGAAYSMGDFGVKFRFAGELGKGATKAEVTGFDTVESKGSSDIRFTLYPYYKFDNLLAGLGFEMIMAGIAEGADADVSWSISPHIVYNVGLGNFSVGLNIGNWKPWNYYAGDIRWQIPVGLTINL